MSKRCNSVKSKKSLKVSFNLKEQEMQYSILQYLKYNEWFAFKIYNGGIYNPKTKKYIKAHTKGIADIFAIKDGYNIWIEVKTETGKQSEYQKQFEKDIKDNGGHYILARSYQDVDDYIVKWFKVRSLLL